MSELFTLPPAEFYYVEPLRLWPTLRGSWYFWLCVGWMAGIFAGGTAVAMALKI